MGLVSTPILVALIVVFLVAAGGAYYGMKTGIIEPGDGSLDERKE